mgnify:CR=1 FL=1
MSMSAAAAGSNDTAGSSGTAVNSSEAQELVCSGKIKIIIKKD